jgi:hypothetical protein
MALITTGSQVASASLVNQSDGVSGLVPYVGDTVIINVDTQYTPNNPTVSNCTATRVTTSGSNPSSQTRLTISLASSSTGTFSCSMYQNYGGRTLSVTGTVQSGTYSGPPRASMSMGGDDTGQSINLELGNSATSSINLNDSTVRSLANASGGGPIDIGDFYGRDASNTNPPFGLAITSNFSSTVGTDTNIPAFTSGSGQLPSTSSMWRRMRLTNTGSSGNKNLYVRGKRDGSATYYYGDMQIAAYVIDAEGSSESVQTLDTPTGIQTGWKTRQTMYAQTDTTWTAATQGNPHYTVTDADGNSSLARNGQLNIMTTNRTTTSSGTGRLSNLAANYNGASNLGYGFFETSVTSNTSPYVPSSNAYYHALSPTFYLANGEYLDIYYGVDCPSWHEVRFEII